MGLPTSVSVLVNLFQNRQLTIYPLNSPDKPISARDDEVVPGWFDILDFPYDNAVDEDTVNLYASARLINAIIDMERDELVRTLRRRGGLAALGEDPGPKETVGEFGTLKEREWANKRIVLGGFSQGSVMTLLTGLTAKERLAGLLVFSGFLPMRKKLGIVSGLLDILPFLSGGSPDFVAAHQRPRSHYVANLLGSRTRRRVLAVRVHAVSASRFRVDSFTALQTRGRRALPRPHARDDPHPVWPGWTRALQRRLLLVPGFDAYVVPDGVGRGGKVDAESAPGASSAEGGQERVIEGVSLGCV